MMELSAHQNKLLELSTFGTPIYVSGAPKVLYCSFNDKWKNKTLTNGKEKERYDELFNKHKLNRKYYGTPLGTIDDVNYKMVSMGKHWINADIDLETLFNVVAVEGYPIAAQMKDGHRTSEHFVKTNIAMVDIDDGLTIEQAEQHEFYKDYAAGWYTSPSHTEEAHRFRIVFVLERTITNEKDLRAIYTALIKVFGGDAACKDAARLFYGTTNAKKSIRKGKFIPNNVIDKLIDDGMIPEPVIENDDYQDVEITDNMKRYVLEKLKNTYIGDYPTWRDIAWGLKSGGFSLDEFKFATINGMMSQKDSKDCEKIWQAGKTNGQITMGTVWHYIGGMKGFYEEYPDERKKKIPTKTTADVFAKAKKISVLS